MGSERVGVSRRNLVRGAAGASAVAAIASVAKTDNAIAYSPGEQETRARYRETEHVKAFYRTNGYETKNKN